MNDFTVSSAADDFVAKLSEARLTNVFNPYRDICDIYDAPDASIGRKTNLSVALNAAIELNVRTIWVARDLGYRGGRRTGLALTDEAHIQEHSRLLGGVELHRTTRGPLVKERTSTIIWRMLMRINQPVFLWNAFPLHPHEADNPMTNRCHTSAERNVMSWALHDLIKLLRPDQVFTIGGDARKCLENMEIESVAFRHPSYGGQTQFIKEVECAYALENDFSKNINEQHQMTFL
jgi:uracil-DNA glycosylase